MTVYVIPDNVNMTPANLGALQANLQEQHRDEQVIVLPPRSTVILDRQRCQHCGQPFGES